LSASREQKGGAQKDRRRVLDLPASRRQLDA
jgi:hypothetical protein